MLKRFLAAGIVGVLALLGTALPASAIKYGEPDAGKHPYVGSIFLYTKQDVDHNQKTAPVLAASGFCSGTQMDADTFLTAGHCTFGAEAAAIWFGEDLRDLPVEDFLFFDDARVKADAYSEAVLTHPEFDASGFYLRDVGVANKVKFKEDFTLPEYGQLPRQGYWNDQLALNKKRRDSYTTVGYGLQWAMPIRGKSNPAKSNARQSEGLWVKLKAHPELIGNRQFGGGKANDAYVVLTNNANTGGVCFGDSGGPTVISRTNTVVAVTSFLVNATCSGTSGVHRLDTAVNLDWLRKHIR